MKLTLQLRPQGRRLLLAASVFVGCWFFLTWVVQPLWGRLTSVTEHIESQQEKLATLNRLLSDTQAVANDQAVVGPYLTQKSGGETEGEFLIVLEGLSREASIHLNLKPRPVKIKDRISRFEVELDVEGSQQQIMTFLDALLQSSKLIAFERLRISSVPAKADLLRANLVIQQVTLR